MLDFFNEHIVHVIAALTVLSRLADVFTTYLVSPTLKLEANSIVRKLGWKFAMLTVLVGLIPYYSIPLGIVLMTVSFLVAASNASKILMGKFLGEDAYAKLSRQVVLAAPPGLGWIYLLLPAVLFSIPGWVLFMFYPNPTEPAVYFAEGIIVYAFAIAFWGSVRYARIRREGRLSASPPVIS